MLPVPVSVLLTVFELKMQLFMLRAARVYAQIAPPPHPIEPMTVLLSSMQPRSVVLVRKRSVRVRVRSVRVRVRDFRTGVKLQARARTGFVFKVRRTRISERIRILKRGWKADITRRGLTKPQTLLRCNRVRLQGFWWRRSLGNFAPCWR